jgi:hypothetical protein
MACRSVANQKLKTSTKLLLILNKLLHDIHGAAGTIQGSQDRERHRKKTDWGGRQRMKSPDKRKASPSMLIGSSVSIQ